MGGYGSGRRFGLRVKETVECCSVVSSAQLVRQGPRALGTVTWTNTATGEKTASIGYEVKAIDPADAWIRLWYTLTREKEDVDYRVRLTTTPLPWGGVRWWFVCPLNANGLGCGRRCGKLYLPPGGRYFGCRLCYDLTYESAQEAHKFDRFYAMLAWESGIPPAMVKRLMKR